MITVKRSVLWAVVVAVTLSLAVLCTGTGMTADDGSTPYPWRIDGIEVGKWRNGMFKATIWAHGSFPMPWGSGVPERPTWFINGVDCGHSTTFFDSRKNILNGFPHLKENEPNTVTVKFFRPPNAGASYSHTFFFEPGKVSPGGYKLF